MKPKPRRLFHLNRGMGGWYIAKDGRLGRFFYSRAKARTYQRRMNDKIRARAEK